MALRSCGGADGLAVEAQIPHPEAAERFGEEERPIARRHLAGFKAMAGE